MIPAPGGPLPTYRSTPAGDGPWPGVVVIHDIFGMSGDLRRQCDWLASEGYLAVGPSLYSRGRTLACVRSTLAQLKAGSGSSFDDIEAARTSLAADPQCTGQLGVIGYCMGGGFSLLLAPGGRYAASSVNYGAVPDDAEAFLAGACPVVASYGGRDRTLKGVAARLDDALAANDVVRDVKEYPEAGHSFLNDHDGGPGVLFAVVGRLAGAGYHEASAADARRRIIEFFDRHLKQS